VGGPSPRWRDLRPWRNAAPPIDWDILSGLYRSTLSGIAAAPALTRGMSSLPNSVASFIGSKPRIRNELIPSR
jgi:hypothetical protein